MSYDVIPGVHIALQPADTTEEVLRNVAFLLATMRGSACLARDFGSIGLDRPIAAAHDAQAAAIYEAIATYEPRAVVQGVTIDGDVANGVYQPVVKVNINA